MIHLSKGISIYFLYFYQCFDYSSDAEVPDLPEDMNLFENPEPGTSKTVPIPKKTLMRKRRAEMSEEERKIANKRKSDQQKLKRAAMSDEEKEKKSKERAEKQKQKRAAMSDEDREKKNKERAEKQKQKRAAMSDEDRERKNKEKAEKQKQKNAEMTDQEKEAKRKKDANRKSNAKSHMNPKDGLRSYEVLQGTLLIKKLEDTEDSIGSMTHKCKHCGALKFPKETPSSCCSDGKIQLMPFPKPPPNIHKLWIGDDQESTLFRKHARTVNNAVCLTSLEAQERRVGYTPSVIFQGKVHHRVGPLLPCQGETPRFAQLYVFDPALESTRRFENLILPSNLNSEQQKMMQDILFSVQEELHDVNPFIQDFLQIMDIPEEELANGKIVISARKPTVQDHSRRYNLQSNLQEVSILTNGEPNDLILQRRGGGLQYISDLNPKGMPLHFTLLFPHGTYGWDQDSKQRDGKRRITTREFYVFHLNIRECLNENFLHRAGRLFQEWLCMAWIWVENQRLNYQRQNQKALRADTYKNLKEATLERQRELEPRTDGIFRDDHLPSIGRKILSSSFSGGPRWYNAKFQDGMAICREYHKPDYFITMTCNPNWPEIKSGLLSGQTPQDRPDLVSKVFKLKKDQLMKDLTAGEILGETVAHMHVTEFQKRGLPHEHILLINANHDRPLSLDLVDSIVIAELPPSSADTDDEAVKKARDTLEEIVLTNMIHGPCGSENPAAPCMENGKCSKGFPKDFNKQTIVDPDNFYAIYRRRSPSDGGRTAKHPKTGRMIDNRWVVPYNPVLSLRYNCHINMEICSSPRAAKYLYKYVTKGNDRAMVSTEVEGQPRDEIADYVDLRSVGSSEAAWHLLAYPITERYPAVMALRVHLRDEQQVVFDMYSEDEALEKQRDTELTAFFKFNESRGDMQHELLPVYVDMPKGHIYDKTKKEWRPRKRNRKEAVIGRIHTVHPVAGDTYYLRMLLHNNHCKGKKSFEDLLTMESGHKCETYKEVCSELGLLSDDREWQKILAEAAVTRMCPQIREMFTVILIFVQPTNPKALFEEFWKDWTDDFEYKAKKSGKDLSESQLKTMLLLDLDMRLQSYESNLSKHGLPEPSIEDLASVETITCLEPAVIREELEYNVDDLTAVVEERLPSFTQEQADIFNTVMDAVNLDASLLVFIDARGGCGKTFLLNTILSAVRSMEPRGSTALAMATTGIAANLLDLGRTFHSRLKAPLTPTEESTLHISAQSSLAKLIRMSKLLMIDEATMLDRYMLEALDRTLRDLMGKPDQEFGGKIIILAGDFRQCLPVVPGASRPGTIKHSINQSHLWNKFRVLHLSQNMRVRASGDPELEAFDEWTLGVGNGIMDTLEVPSNIGVTEITPNSSENRNSEGRSMLEFCQKIFPNIAENLSVDGWLDGRTILAVTNKEVGSLNTVMNDLLPGTGDIFCSSDTLENTDDLLRFNTEYLNTLTPNGFPPHQLVLKPGMPMMLLRNLNPRQGLCNGSRLVYEKSLDRVLQCKLTGSGRTVLIPRIRFIPKLGEYPFSWQRRQFPVKPAFALTINKSQGISNTYIQIL